MTVCAKQVSKIQCPRCKKMVVWGQRNMHKCHREYMAEVYATLASLEAAAKKGNK